jgi:dephospho-CoA kinase
LEEALTGLCQVSASESARALLGMVAGGKSVPAEALEEFAHAVLDADPIGHLVARILDDSEPCRLALAMELAGLVLDHGAVDRRRAGRVD